MNPTWPVILPTMAAISVPAVSAGVGLLSLGTLLALHHLRSQPPKRIAATLVFWQQAMRSPQTRVLWSRRFTHRRTFLLLASILFLWALALIADRLAANGSQDIIVIDAGEDTAAPGADHRTLVRELADAATADLRHTNQRPGLVVAGPFPSMLVRPDQPAAITEQALATLSSEPGASASSLALQVAGLALGDTNGRIAWYTASAALPARLPEDVQRRIVLHQIAPPPAIAICGVTFVPAPDGSAHGTLCVSLMGVPEAGVSIRAKPKNGPAVESAVNLSKQTEDVAFENWPADGQPATLTLLNAPGAPSTHVVEYRVPDRTRPIFRFDAGTPAALKMALLTVGDEAKNASSENVISVIPLGGTIPSDAAAAVIVDNEGSTVNAGIPLQFGATLLVNGLNLEGAVAAQGPALSEAGTPVLTAGSAVVASLDLTPHRPTLTLSSAIVDSAANLPRHAVFPVLMGRLCQALTDRRDAPVVISRSRSALDPLWAGPSQTPAAGEAFAADPPATATFTSSPLAESRTARMPWSAFLLAGAAVLLIAESLLHAARRIV